MKILKMNREKKQLARKKKPANEEAFREDPLSILNDKCDRELKKNTFFANKISEQGPIELNFSRNASVRQTSVAQIFGPFPQFDLEIGGKITNQPS